jgi:hypothetical protein
LDGSESRDPDIISEVHLSNNHFINDDSEGIGNAIAIQEGQSANSLLSITANNLENLNGNFMVYLYNWADKDSGPVDMTSNWWGTASVSKIRSMIYDHRQDEYVPLVNYDQEQSSEIAGAGSDLSYPPMADAGEDQEAVKPDDIVTLNGSLTYDPDNIMSYKWIQTEGQTVTIHNAISASATFIAPSPKEADKGEGILKFKLTVTDTKGFYDTDEVTVKIKASGGDIKRQISSGCFISLAIPVCL